MFMVGKLPLLAFNTDTVISVKMYYIDLSRAKSEALVDIYSLLKQNVKSCNANQAATATKIAKKAVGLIRTKNNFARAAHFFLFLFVVISAEDGLHCPLQNRPLD